MSSAFDSYEEEWFALKESVTSAFEKDAKKQRGEQRKATLRRISMDIEEADEIIDQMESEAKGRAKLMIRVRGYKNEVKNWRSTITTLSNTDDRSELLSSTTLSENRYSLDIDDEETNLSSAAGQRTRLLDSTNRLNTSSQRLDNAERTALESEELGGNILQNLYRQRGQLENTRDTLGEADTSIGRATGTLKKMFRTQKMQRYMLIGFGVVLSALVILILWHKLS